MFSTPVFPPVHPVFVMTHTSPDFAFFSLSLTIRSMKRGRAWRGKSQTDDAHRSLRVGEETGFYLILWHYFWVETERGVLGEV